MGSEVTDYTIGDKGVQLTGTPLHTPEGGLITGQNVEFVREEGLGGIASRRSLTRLNSSALAGTIQHVQNLPFPFPTNKILMVGLNVGEAGLSWLKSTDGAVFTSVATTVLNRAVSVAKFSADVSIFLQAQIFYMPQRSGSYRRRFYFASDNYVVWFNGMVTTPTRPPVDQYDGSVGLELFRLPNNPTATLGSFPYWIIGLWVINGLIWMCIFDPGGVAPDHKGRVLTFDPEDGTLALVGNRFGNGTGENTGGMPYALAPFAGRIFVGTMGISGNPAGKVYSILPAAELAWTLDHSFAADEGYVMDMLVFQGNLYLAMSADSSGTATVVQRTPTGTYAVSFTGPAVGVAYNGGLVEFNSLLFCCYYRSGFNLLVKKFDGTSWATDKDVGTDFAVTGHAPGTPLVFEGNLYWPFYDGTNDSATTAFLLKRTPGGVWTQVLTARGLRGGLGFYRPDAT